MHISVLSARDELTVQMNYFATRTHVKHTHAYAQWHNSDRKRYDILFDTIWWGMDGLAFHMMFGSNLIIKTQM